MTTPTDPFDLIHGRARELVTAGLDSERAWGQAWLEHRIKNFTWPLHWGNDLRVLIYGDFDAPDKDVEIPDLGIVVHHEKQEKTVIGSARCVLEASVQIPERTVPAILDAARRINVLLGSWTLVAWGNCACGWWSYITHENVGGVLERFDHGNLNAGVQGVLRLPGSVRQKVDAALYWIREPRALLTGHFRGDLLRMYSAYWNAFECLVEAIAILRPEKKPTKAQKQQQIDDFLAARDGRLTSADVQKCYLEIVNPGFVGKASHALQICFPENATDYIRECFELPSRADRLYDIRNAINHGDVDAENPEERIRVKSRLGKLWMIVWGMFGRLVPFPAPVDRKPQNRNSA